MTNRQQSAYYVMLAWSFAYTARQQGANFNRAITCLDSVLDNIVAKLTNKQRKQVMKSAEKNIDKLGDKVNVYDFMDWVVEAMKIIKTGKERWLNSMLALAVTNVPEEVEI